MCAKFWGYNTVLGIPNSSKQINVILSWFECIIYGEILLDKKTVSCPLNSAGSYLFFYYFNINMVCILITAPF